MRSRPIAALSAVLAALALAAAPAATAQSAGDEQYADPFENEPPSGGGAGDGGDEPTSDDGGGGDVAPTTVAPTDTDATVAQETLPRTGAPLVLLAGAGGVLLAGGATLRRRL